MDTITRSHTETQYNKTVYVIGHRNPDTDSIVSAAAYARFKQLQGFSEHRAARAGKANPQTEYIFNRFSVPIPEYLPDLIPKVGYYMHEGCETVEENSSLWRATTKMEQNYTKVLPVVDAKGKYLSLLHYSGFAKNIIEVLDPEKQTATLTNIDLLTDTLSAQPVVVHDSKKIFKCAVLSAAAEFESFKKMLSIYPPENIVVVTGDRIDIQKHCVETGVRVLIITSGNTPDKELRTRAEEKGVSILVSPFDTTGTTTLVLYSAPVSSVADNTVMPVKATDTLRKVKALLQNSPGRCLPVVDDTNTLLGIISESDLLHDANIEIIMVDHNEMSQAIEGAENYKIREVLDHHRLGSFGTRYPITFINKPVGATSTIVTNIYRQNRVAIPKAIASILLCGILSDTLVLKSATTTDEDRETARYLSNITDLDIETLGQEILTASSHIGNRNAAELVHQDMKEYNEGEHSFTVSQIEVNSTDEVLHRKEEFLNELNQERSTRKTLFCALMVTDITRLTSLLLVCADKEFLQVISFPRQEDSIYILKDIVSRKKQLIPLLSEQIEKLNIQ